MYLDMWAGFQSLRKNMLTYDHGAPAFGVLRPRSFWNLPMLLL